MSTKMIDLRTTTEREADEQAALARAKKSRKTPAKRAPRAKKRDTAFEVYRSQLVESIGRIIRFSDPKIPSFDGIAFEMRAGRFTAMATDRVVLGVDAIDVRTPESGQRPTVDDFTVFVPKYQVRMLLALLRSWPAPVVEIAVITGQPTKLELSGVTVGINERVPEWRRLVRDLSRSTAENVGDVRSAAVNPALASKFAHIKGARLYLHENPSKGIFATDKERFVGCLMPIKRHDVDEVERVLDRVAPEAVTA